MHRHLKPITPRLKDRTDLCMDLDFQHIVCLFSCPLKHSSVHVYSTDLRERHGRFILTIARIVCTGPDTQHRSSLPQQVNSHLNKTTF